MRPGSVYQMYHRADAQRMARANLPAIRREPLEDVCLQIKLMPPILPGTSTNRCAAVLATAIAPPRAAAVHDAVDLLVDIGAIDNLASEQVRFIFSTAA